MKTRLYRQSDLDSILELFYHNIHTVCVHDYTLEQLDAWAPANPDVYRWQVSLNRNHTLVVEKDSQIIGFGDVGETGYLDRLYVHPDYLHQGIASLLVEQLEKYAKAKGISFMNTAASVTSRPFFDRSSIVFSSFLSFSLLSLKNSSCSGSLAL